MQSPNSPLQDFCNFSSKLDAIKDQVHEYMSTRPESNCVLKEAKC